MENGTTRVAYRFVTSELHEADIIWVIMFGCKGGRGKRPVEVHAHHPLKVSECLPDRRREVNRPAVNQTMRFKGFHDRIEDIVVMGDVEILNNLDE